MKRKLILVCLLNLIAVPVFAQRGKPDVCQVGFVDYSSKEAQSSDTLPVHMLGRFETVTAEEERTTKAYRIPGTKLFIVASVFYTDESMALENAYDSMTLELSISRTPKRDIFSGLRFAAAEVMLAHPRVSRVSTMFKVKGRTLDFVMECRSEVNVEK